MSELTYCGQPVESLSREDLIDALKRLYRTYEAEIEAHRMTLRIWETARTNGRKNHANNKI